MCGRIWTPPFCNALVRAGNAKLIIEYSTPATEAWGKVILLLPKEYHDKFLMELRQNPNSGPGSIWTGLSKEHQAITRPYADENANDALAEVRTISLQAENEFKKIYGLIVIGPPGLVHVEC
ncbi:MAG: hypothetical protein ACI85H_000478 [Paracoccaceae bacterium]|jgi:hypothetical protein